MNYKEKKAIWRYIPFRKSPAERNMAIDEMLLKRVIKGESPNVLRFYQWTRSTASIGRNQSLNAEVNLEEAKRHNVDVVRRISGGGAVFHDSEGEITYAIVCRISDIPKIISKKIEFDQSIPQRYQIILEALGEGLSKIGIEIDTKKIHCPALIMEGKKISGNAQAIRNNVLLQHGTILLNVNPELMYTILKAPEGVSYTKMVQSVRTKVTGILKNSSKIKNKNNTSWTNEELIKHFKSGFETVFNVEFKENDLSDEELSHIKNLEKKRYLNPNWLQKFP